MSTLPLPYPDNRRERNRWIVAQRENVTRNEVDPLRPYAFFSEEERSETGEIVPVSTVFLTNRECPWRCLMCDLWRNTLTQSVPRGAIATQLDYALSQLESNASPARHIKLYNSGSFFDNAAIPREDYAELAARLRSFERVIVESHPALIGNDCLQFRDLLNTESSKSEAPVQLEVAMGLETIHPLVGPQLNKGVTPEQFADAAKTLRDNGIALRVFVLVKPPFLNEEEALLWANRSLDFAFDCGATVVALIPTRPGNGALEELAKRNEYAKPQLATLEAAVDYGVAQRRGRVFADLWDLAQFSDCAFCLAARTERLNQMNRRQVMLPRVDCAQCGADGSNN